MGRKAATLPAIILRSPATPRNYMKHANDMVGRWTNGCLELSAQVWLTVVVTGDDQLNSKQVCANQSKLLKRHS